MKEEVNTEQAILIAAEKEFIEKGYAGSKTTEIAKTAGVTHAMLHYYFRTKDNLFEKVFLEKSKLVASSFAGIEDHNLPFLEKVSKSIETHFNFLAENPKLPFFVLSEIITNEDRKERCKKIFMPVIKQTQERLAKELDEEFQQGNICSIEAIDLLMSIVSLNICVFLARPVVDMITNGDEDVRKQFLEHRREENVRMILARLRP